MSTLIDNRRIIFLDYLRIFAFVSVLLGHKFYAQLVALQQVVIPYQDYLQWFEKTENLVPHEVVALMIQKQYSPFKAWREYLQLTVTEIAKRIDIDETTLMQMENEELKLSKTMQKKIAKALNITLEQLDV